MTLDWDRRILNALQDSLPKERSRLYFSRSSIRNINVPNLVFTIGIWGRYLAYAEAARYSAEKSVLGELASPPKIRTKGKIYAATIRVGLQFFTLAGNLPEEKLHEILKNALTLLRII